MTKNKIINLSDTVYAICTKYPEVSEIMKDLGFVDIVKPGMLQTAGRFMTISKGALMKKIELETIINAFRAKGYEIIR